MSREEVRSIQLEALRAMNEFCLAHEVPYFLYFGTLLGAVRHQGYIPWDDDIDVAMNRSDYERFCQIARAGFGRYRLDAMETSEAYFMPFAKLSDASTVLVERTNLELHTGVNIDIFPIDGLPNNWTRRFIHRHHVMCYRTVLNAKVIAPRQGRRGSRRLLLFIGRKIAAAIPARWIAVRLQVLARHFPVDESKFLSALVGPWSEVVPSDALSGTITTSFEGNEYPVPVGSDRALAALYGSDYMTPPPISRRATHHAFDAFAVTDG